MKKFYLKRLEKLAAFLDNLPRKKFNFASIISKADKRGCGTICCAFGWTPKVFPRIMKWASGCGDIEMRGRKNISGCLSAMSEILFGTNFEEYSRLFEPSSTECPLLERATPQAVAKNIRKFIKEKQHENKT